MGADGPDDYGSFGVIASRCAVEHVGIFRGILRLQVLNLLSENQRRGRIEAGCLQGLPGPLDLPGRVAAFLSRHQQMDWKALEERTRCDHFNASTGHDASVERDHRPMGFGEALGDRQDRFVQAANHPLDAATEIALRVFCRFIAPTQDEQANFALLFREGLRQIPVTLSDIRGIDPGSRGALAQPIQEDAAPLARRLASLAGILDMKVAVSCGQVRQANHPTELGHTLPLDGTVTSGNQVTGQVIQRAGSQQQCDRLRVGLAFDGLAIALIRADAIGIELAATGA